MTDRVESIESFVVNAQMRNWVFVRVITADGLTGWGEATLEWKTQAVVGAIADVSPLVVGQDPMRLEHIWQRMYRGQFWKGGVIGMTALSGIDMALHDVKARALGVPIYELLGGAVRDRLRTYDHLGGGDPDSVYGSTDPARMAAAAQRSVDEGFGAIKVLAVPVGGLLASGPALRSADAVMARLRDTVGPDVDIMVDFHGRTTPAAAVAFGNIMAPYRPWFYEEVCQPEDTAGMRQVADAVAVPLAAGERLVGRHQFRDLLDTRSVAVVQPDVCHAGGLSETRRIAALAETFGVGVAPHNPLGPIATMHNLHLATCTPNWLIQEQMRSAAPWFDDVISWPIRPVDGWLPIPTGVGLGVDVDLEVCAAHPYEREPQLAAVHLEGGEVADW